MPAGPGKYDEECTQARIATAAQGVVLIVIGGIAGSGFSVQTEDPTLAQDLPKLLRSVADQIEQSL